MKKEEQEGINEFQLVTGLMGGVWLLVVILLIVFWKRLPPEMPWFYSLPRGEDQLIGKRGVGLVMGGLGIVLGLDAFLANIFREKEEFLAKMLLWGGLATTGLVLLSWVKILLIIL